MHWEWNWNPPGSISQYFQWCRLKGKAVDRKPSLGQDSSTVFLEGRFERQLISRIFSTFQEERIGWGKVHTSSWRAACRRDKWVTKVGITVIADIAAWFLFSCSTVLPNSYYKLCCVPAVDGNTPPIDMEGLLAGRAELQKFEIPCSVSYKGNQKLFSY